MMLLWEKFKASVGISSKPPSYLRALKERDISDILRIEQDMYNYPWSEGVFRDCLRVGYFNWAFIKDDKFIGYAILSIAVGEAHILNICLDRAYTGQGLGEKFLSELMVLAKNKGADCVFLEVRVSNISAIKLYEKLGFKQIGERKKYYQCADGREDAIVFSLDFDSKWT